MGKGKVAVFGLASAILTGIVAKVSATCPDLITQWPALLTAGIMGGIGLWMQSPKDTPKG